MFKWIWWLFLLALLLVAVVVGVTFASENKMPVAIVVFNYSLPELSVGLWMVISLFFGAIVGLCVSFFPLLFSTNKDRRIERLQTEIDRLRVSGVKG